MEGMKDDEEEVGLCFVGGYFLVKLERGDIGSILLVECNLKWELNYFLKLFLIKGKRK